MGGPASVTVKPYIVVVGGSFVGVRTAQLLAPAFHKTHRILLIEKNSHFQHIFAFPRFSVTKGSADPRWEPTSGNKDGSGIIDKRKAFIPFNPGTFKDCPEGSGWVVQAKATDFTRNKVKLDRKIELDGIFTDEVPFEFLVIATGARYTPPSTLPTEGKDAGLEYLFNHCSSVEKANKIVIIGGGAVGVQMSTDIKELYPHKDVTLVHSRTQIMNNFHQDLHNVIAERAKTLGINLVLGHRVIIPQEGFPNDGSVFNVKFLDGGEIPADLAIVSTGQTPNSQFVAQSAPSCVDARGFIKVKPTLQVVDPALPHVFALGDVADTGAHKAARPGWFQADTVVANIASLLNKESAARAYVPEPAGIHLSLGINENVLFTNPADKEKEPVLVHQHNGRLDCFIGDVWKRRAVGKDYRL
ncbi:amid-like NADH oxidoreductase [Cystobasidium minutum MCA 4210]|uniref:amid-like NADH oxidoreductase n=1 Tax=Cystobasidium minutum MCA 4210 TaxID=1397322 RepID=UPI0034CECFF0|eukprot:jgi/Rhomi1/192522/gm1.736_g